MKMKKGFTAIELLVVIGILGILFATVFSFGAKHVVGNKQIIDFNHQRFNVAYVRVDNNTWEKVKIKAWKDWKDSDAVQIIKHDGNAIYTHLCNVKLCAEE